MKKILICLTTILSLLLFSEKVNASSFDVSIVGNDTFNNEITLYAQINNLVDFNGSCSGLCGLVGTLNYDTSKLELVSINPLEEFSLTQGKSLVLYKATGVSNGTKILSMKFKNKNLQNNEKTSITLTNITASDGSKDINAIDTSKSIKYVVENKQTNINTTNKNNSNNTTENIIEEIIKSSNAYLSSLTVSNGNIKFSKDILTYDIVVDYNTEDIEIIGTLEDEKSTIEGLGKHTLNIGNNKFEIKVKAEDGSEKIYTINVKREEKLNDVEEEQIEIVEKENFNFIIPISIGLIILVGLIIFIKKKKK